MANITIKGTDGIYDGDWHFDEKLTNGEYHRIFLLSGTPGGHLGTAVSEGNVGAICALAAVVLERHGKTVDFDLLMDSTETPELEDDPVEAEADASPPAQTRGADVTSGSAEKTGSSGRSGSNGSESLGSDRSSTTRASSAPSVTSGQPTLVT